VPERRRLLPVVGYRTWKLSQTAEGLQLKSVFKNCYWTLGVTRATCQQCAPWVVNRHAVPNPSCECGLYAFSSAVPVWTIEPQLDAIRRSRQEPVSVWGAVVGWGRVVQHGQLGWRAEYARPVALLDTGDALLEAAATRYGVPLLSWRGVQMVALEHGAMLT
jgi:hypothetical protein